MENPKYLAYLLTLMDFDKEYKLYKIGLAKKVSKRYEEKAAGNRTEDLDLIDDSQCETEIKRLLKTIDKTKRWKVTSNDINGLIIDKRITFTCPEWKLSTDSKSNDKLYVTVLVLSKDALQRAINKFPEKFAYPNTERKDQADVNIPYFIEKNECEWFFYTLVRSTSIIFSGDYSGQLAVMKEMYSEDEDKALSSQDHLIVNSKDAIEYTEGHGFGSRYSIGYCYRLSVSNLFLSLRMATSAAIRKVEEIRHLDIYPKVNETLSNIGLAGKVQKKYEKRDAIEEISYANCKNVVKNLICYYSKAHYADLIDSMKSTNDLIFRHIKSSSKDQGSGVFVRGKNELWLCLGEYGTILNITSKHLEVLRGSILMNKFTHGTLKSKSNFINEIIDDYSDFVVSVIREGHEEIADFLESISEKVEEYEYHTVKDIFSELNESTTSLGLGKKVISKDKERNKNKANALYDMSSIDSVMECLKSFLKANGYKEVEDVYMAYEKKTYDILDMMEDSGILPGEERAVVFAIGLGKTVFKVRDHMPTIWQLSLYEHGGSVVMRLNFATEATPEMVIGPKDNALGWYVTPDKLMNVVTFCASYDDSKPLEDQRELLPYKFHLQESTNLGLNKRVSSKFKTEVAPNSVRDLDEEIDEEIDDSKDFLSVLLREAKKIGILPKGRYEDLEPTPRDSSEGQFDFTGFKLYSQKEDGDWSVDPVCNVNGYIKVYWPLKLYSSAEIYTLIGEGWRTGDDNFFVIRIVFGRVGGAPYRWIDHIEYGKASQKSGYKPKDYGSLAVADLDKIFSTKVDRDENDCIALTKTNAMLILDLMKSFLRHKKDQVSIKVKTLGWHVDNAGHWIKDERPHYETQEVPLWDYLSRLRTKKSNKAFCLAVSNNCWKKDFNL